MDRYTDNTFVTSNDRKRAVGAKYSYSRKPVKILKRSRPVSLLLAIGIMVMPFIFAWFVLGRGYSVVARAICFTWLAFNVYLVSLGG